MVIDLCAPRVEWHDQVSRAIEFCREQSGRIWLYVGLTQTLIYNLQREIRRVCSGISARVAMRLALDELEAFSQDKQWIASLLGEGDVFSIKNVV